ncbi:MAG: ADP-ribosylation factor-like protein [Promethearchaeota archaeon]
MELNNEIDLNKILFTGLDDAGKTSIIKALQREFSMISNIKPTKQAQRRIFEYMGKKIAEWDLGGQARYRIAYLKSPDKYFDHTSVCIYIIDIQEIDRLEESLSYLVDVVKQFKKLEISPPIYVFLHKFDPALKKNAPIETAKRILDIENRIKKIIDNNHSIEFFNTSIYDLWSVMTSFSKILLTLYPQSELIDKTVKDFTDKAGADAILILDNNSLVVAQSFKIEEARAILETTTPYFLTLNDSFQQSENANQLQQKMIIERSEKLFLFDEIRLEAEQLPLFLLIMKDKGKEFDETEINAFKKIIKDIIKPS